MAGLLRHTAVSVAVGMLLAGLLAAILMATLPVKWRSPTAVGVAAAATVAVVMGARGIRPPAP